MADKLRQGVPTDIVILTAKIIADLAEENLVVPASDGLLNLLTASDQHAARDRAGFISGK